MNNYEAWHHIATAPKDREILVWDGDYRYVAEWDARYNLFMIGGCLRCWPTHWRGCPPPPVESLPDDPEIEE